jgi:Thioesterase-like superfamily
VPDAFFLRDGDRFVPTELTRGPWDPDSQHAGPPAALLGRAVARCGDGEGAQLGRITFEILRAVPLVPLSVQARVVRPGRSVELLEASLSDADGEVMRAAAWRLRTRALELPPQATSHADPPPGPAAGEERPLFDSGYHVAVEERFVRGSFTEPGPATVWIRMRHPLVAGEETSPLTRVLVAADSANGVSTVLDWRRYVFINTDLTVYLTRLPEGEWVCLDAVTTPEATGVGMSHAALFDERGPLGRALQTLLIRER